MKKILFLITVMLSLIAGDCTPLSDEEKASRQENAFDLSGAWTIEGGAWGLTITNEVANSKNDIFVTLTRKGAVLDEEKKIIEGTAFTLEELTQYSQQLTLNTRGIGLFGGPDADGGENVSRDFGKTSEILSPLCAPDLEKSENPLKTKEFEGQEEGEKVTSKTDSISYCLTAKTQEDTDPLVMDINLTVSYVETIIYTKEDEEGSGTAFRNRKSKKLTYTATLTSE